MIKVYKIPNDLADRIEGWVTGSKVPWFYFADTLGPNFKGKTTVNQETYTIVDLPRFTHFFFPNSKTLAEDNKFVMPLAEWVIKEMLPNFRIRRAMGNMTTQLSNASTLLNIPHMDSEDSKRYTFLYYVNNSDGKTVFFQDGKIVKEVEPIKGTGVLFPSNIVHAGQLPSINKTRYVINMIFESGIDVMVA